MSRQVLSPQVLSAWLGLLRSHAELTRAMNAQLIARHGITLNDYDVMVNLAEAPGGVLRRVDLADRVLLTASGITRLLEGLERAGWVCKQACDKDARVTYAVLTDAGVRKIEEARESHNADIEELFGSRFAPEEREQLTELLGRLPLAHTAEACSA